MPGSTPKFAFPYPLGTDLIADGDDTIKALAEKVDTVLGTPTNASSTKPHSTPGFKPVGWTEVPASQVTITMAAPGLVLVRASTDIQALTGCGSCSVRIGTNDASMFTWLESGTQARTELQAVAWLYLPAGATALRIQVTTFANSAGGITLNSTRWGVFAVGGTPTLT